MPQTRSLYAVKDTGLCPACGFGRDSVSHFRLHIPRDRWPDSMRGKRVKRVVIDGKVRPIGWVDPDALTEKWLCVDCGTVSVGPHLEEPSDDCLHVKWVPASPMAASGEASSPASPDLVEADGAGSASSPEAAPLTTIGTTSAGHTFTELTCVTCGYDKAKTPHGLKVHIGRNHKAGAAS